MNCWELTTATTPAAAVVELTTATTPAFSTTRGKSYSAGSLIRTARCGEHWKWEEPI